MRVKLLETAAMEVVGLGQAERARVRVNRKAGMRFRRQVHEYNVALEAEPLTEASAVFLEERFRSDYEQVVGRGSAYTDADVELVSLCVEVRVPLADRPSTPVPAARATSERADRPVGERRAWFSGSYRDCAVYRGDSLGPESTVTGPAFVELPTTTVVVYPEQRLQVDSDGNMRLRFT